MPNTNVTGSCLCGSIQYEIEGDANRFYHCHCQRCRKTTGTGHASNILVTPENSLSWKQGEELLKIFKVPDAERFYNCFCSNCGSPLPRVVPQLGGIVIPAGTLDDEPPIKPQARIFWSSRAQWSCSDESFPVFDEYMP